MISCNINLQLGVCMSDVEANDIYPLTVEEYETAATVAADVEVE